MCQACIIGCAVSAFLYPFLKSYLALVITAVIFGLPDGGFVASLSVVTTEIVGPEKMIEGFGFMLFCQSYSNVLGPPLSGNYCIFACSYLTFFSLLDRVNFSFLLDNQETGRLSSTDIAIEFV